MPRWTNKCRDSLFAMREMGMTWTKIADKLGRDVTAVASFYRDEVRRRNGVRRYNLKRPIVRKREMYGPPAPSPDFLYTRAVSRLMQRIANDSGLSAEDVRARLLGKEPPRRPDSHYFGTSSIMRLAA